MKKTLLLYCHPSPHKSRYNRRLLEVARQYPSIEVRDLYELYPSLHVHEEHEQQALRGAELVVFQFPVYWFSAPSLLKEWMDVVLQAGFAYGDGGDALRGKKLLLAVSTGGAESAYANGETHGADIGAFLLPFKITAEFCGMTVVDPFVTFDVRQLDYDAINERAQAYVDRLMAIAPPGEVADGRP